MADTLVELVQQGDPGTAASEEQAQALNLLSYRELYDLWESQPWAVGELDFSQDVLDWHGLAEQDQADLMWGFSQFYVGEQRVAAELAPVVHAAPTSEMQVFLSTQLVDEARHHVFFDRFYAEVIGLAGGSMKDRLEAVYPELNAGYMELFDGNLHGAVDALRRDPSDMEALVRAVTIYHMIVEGTLALTGQHFFIENLENRLCVLPGFVDGFKRVSRDEHRHVAFGTRFLRDMAARDERYLSVIQETLAEQIPLAAQVMVPKSANDPYNWEIMGFTSIEINEFAFKALNRRLKAMRVPLPTTA